VVNVTGNFGTLYSLRKSRLYLGNRDSDSIRSMYSLFDMAIIGSVIIVVHTFVPFLGR
jgi:hypothetical protein